MNSYFFTEKENCNGCTDISCAASRLSGDELSALHLNSRETFYKKGEIIIREGTLNSHIIYLKTGLVKEFTRGPGNNEQIISLVKKHSYLGLASLFGDRVNNYSYAALEDLTVCNIDVELFKKMIKTNGNFAYEILISVSRDSLQNFQRFVVQTQKKMYGRMADALIYFSDFIYEKNEFTLPFSRQELAELIGISRESATRVLLKFNEDGIVSISGRKITLKNLDMLRQISKNG